MARIYTNFAKSTLASGIGAGAVSVSVAAGEGALFPAAGAGSTFDAVIYNTSGLREIVSCTSRTGDVLTIVRAQQGTTALAWLASDKIGHRFTAAALNSLLFIDSLQQNVGVWCGTAGGTADALTLTPSAAVTAMGAGHKFIFKAGASANTGAATMAVSGLASFALQNNGAALSAGDIEASKWYEVLYDGAAGQLQKYHIPSGTILQNSQSAAYTTVLSDAGKHIYHPGADTTARTWTIDSNVNVPYPIGTAITFVNDTSAGVITIAITSDTLVLAGAGTTGSRTLAASGMATAIKMTSTRWMISGSGLT